MELPNCLCIQKSSIHGVGLFTKVPYKQNEVCFVAKRQILQIQNPDVPIAHIDGRAIIPKIHCPQIAPDTYHVYSFDSFMNHSDDPNTKIIYVDELNYYHVATRDIEAFEELTVSYDEVYTPAYPVKHL